MSRNNVTVKMIADAINVTQATASNKLNGRYAFTLDEAVLLANMFESSVEYLFGGKENGKKNTQEFSCS